MLLGQGYGPRSGTITPRSSRPNYSDVSGGGDGLYTRVEERHEFEGGGKIRGLWGMQTAEMRAGHSNLIGQGCTGMEAAGMTDMAMRVGKVEQKLANIEVGCPIELSSTVRISPLTHKQYGGWAWTAEWRGDWHRLKVGNLARVPLLE